MKMKTLILSALACAFALSAGTGFAATETASPRLSSELSNGWKFLRQKAEPNAPTEAWETVAVPHTWNALDVQTEKKYYRGTGWYARPLDIPKAWQGKRVFIRFEAASIVATPFINGQPLEEHRGAFTAFCYELTPHVRFGEKNELRVQVNNGYRKDIAPLGGDFNMCGGLYRPVHLIVTDAVCVSPLDLASPGVYLTTQSLSDTEAAVEVKTLVSNGSPAKTGVVVETEIRDAAGKVVAVKKENAQIEAGQTLTIAPVLKIAQPRRWNGRTDPYLYTATVRVLRGGKPVDAVSQTLGLRTVAIAEDQGFLLNGKPYPVHGVNRHQERRDKGWALSPVDHEQDAKLILDMGATAVRNAHYPQSSYWHDLADRSGLLLWDEVPLVNGISDLPGFDTNVELQLREMIAQLYNHPSVAWWGIFNELGSIAKSPPPDALVSRLKTVVQETDPSRLIVGATCFAKRSFNQIADHTCWNRYPGWYNPLPASMKKYLAPSAAEIGKRIAISEYGAGGSTTQHQETNLTQPKATGGEFHPEEWQTHVHEKVWEGMRDDPQLWGTFIWCMFDFGSAGRNEGGQPGVNDKGMVTQDRTVRKDAYLFYKANWNPEPMVYIAERRMAGRTLPQTTVKVYSNAPEVELKVNGKSLGKMKPDAVRICRWENVNLTPGKNTVEAVAVVNGKPLADRCEWVLSTQP
jgi:beta-galactosidase